MVKAEVSAENESIIDRASQIRPKEVERLFGYKLKLKNLADPSLYYLYLEGEDYRQLASDLVLENHANQYLQALIVKEKGKPILAVIDRHRYWQNRSEAAPTHVIASLHPENETVLWPVGDRLMIVANGVPRSEGEFVQAPAFSTPKDSDRTLSITKERVKPSQYGTGVIYTLRVDPRIK